MYNNKGNYLQHFLSLNKELALLVEKQVKLGKFANRSEFFRQILRSMFLSNKTDNLDNDRLYSEPYYSELKQRVKNLKADKEKFIVPVALYFKGDKENISKKEINDKIETILFELREQKII